MTKRNLSASFLLRLSLEVLESNPSNSLSTTFLNIFCLLCYFSQILSYLSRIHLEIYETKLTFLLNCFYYTNFANFLSIFQSKDLVIAAYAVIVSVIITFYMYLGGIAALILYFKFRWRNHLVFKIGNAIAATFFRLFVWLFFIPFLEVLVNPFNCDTGSYLTCGNELPSILLVLSAFAIVLSILLALLHLLLHCNYKFQDFMEIRLGLNIFSLIGLTLRCIIPLASILLGQNNYLLVIVMHGFAVTCFLNYIQTFPIRSPNLNPLFFSLLLSFEIVMMVITFWKYFGVLMEESVFYLIMIGFVFSFKTGWSYFFRKRMEIFLSNFSYREFIDYAMEELFYLFHNSSGSTTNFFLLMGQLKFHAKDCNNPICKLKSKTMKKFQELPLIRRTRIVDSFILQKFRIEIEEQSRLKTRANEVLVFKYIGYLINSNCNTSKAFYETQRIKLLYTRRSLLGGIILDGLLRKVERKIRDIEREKTISERKNLEQTLEVSSFFRINRQKVSLEDKIKKLLQKKISFWESYKEGFDSYDHLSINLSSFLDNANAFLGLIEELIALPVVQNEKIALFRFMSVYHCIILNQLSEAIEFEERIDNIRKRFLHIDKQALSPLVFLKDNLVVCEASFLNSAGKILESSKTEKLAKFFGYSIQDIKLLTSIDSLMPNFIAEHHTKLIFWSFVRTRKEQISYEWEILSYAVDKQGFLFPVKMFLGYSFQYANDYVANAGIMRLQTHGYEEVLLGVSGAILGFNREFFDFFNKSFQKLEPKQLEGVCMYSLMPRVKEIIEKEEIFKGRKTNTLRNQIVSMAIPINLTEIIELMSFYNQESEAVENLTSKNNFSSTNTFRTNRSNSNNPSRTNITRSMKQNKDLMIRVNNFLNRLESLKSKREIIMNLFQDHTLSPESLMNRLLDNQAVIRFKCVVDLSFKYHRYGKDPNHIISFCQLVLLKANLVETEAQALKSHRLEESMISDNIRKSIIMPPQNQPEFGIEFDRLGITYRSQPDTKIIAMDLNFNTNNNSFENNQSPKDFKNSLDVVKFNLADSKEKETDKGLIKAFDQTPNLVIDPPDLPQKQSIRSSLKSSENNAKGRLQEAKNQTTEQMALKDMELQASQSSSTNTGKAVFNVLTIVGMLRRKFPKSMYRMNYLLGMQMVLVFCFCMVYYVLAGQYISHSYVPLKTALSNQLEINAAIYISCNAFVNLENQILGFKNLSEFEINEMFTILAQKDKQATNLFYQDRNTQENFEFSNYLQNWRLTFVDDKTFQAKNILLVDETDIILNVINNALENRDLTKMQHLVKVLPRNYIDYLLSTKALRDVMLAEFLSSNQGVTNELLTVLIISMIVVSLCKLIEFALISGFYSKVTRLLNVFLRNSSKDALNESLFLKETLESLNDQTKTWLAVCFSDRLLNKKNYAMQMEDDTQNNVKKKEDQLRKKKQSRIRTVKTRSAIASLRPFSRIKIYLFLIGSGGIIILYFAFNYYFWTNCNQNINDLLSRTDIINNVYIFSAALPVFNNLLLREIIKRDPEYEASNATFQIHANRLSKLAFLLDDRTQFLQTYIRQLPNYILVAEKDLNDFLFSQIVEGDLCSVLAHEGLINDVEKTYCYTCFNGAMEKGILGAINQYLNQIKSIRGVGNMSGVTTDDQMAQKVKEVKDFIQGSTYSEIVIGTVYLNNALMVFYNYFSQYYLDQLYTSINQLTIFVWIMCVACLSGMFLLVIFTWGFGKHMYGLATGSLGLIPLEKLSFDEQTIFLIKNYYKDQT